MVLLRIVSLALVVFAASVSAQTVPVTASGKPDLQGIWQVHNRAAYNLEDHTALQDMPPGFSVVDGGEIPYQDWALAQKRTNFAERATLDPLASCYLPGVPRIMYLDHPFQIFQTDTQIAIAFEWSLAHRMIEISDEPSIYAGIEAWMGRSRGRWEGDTLVVEVTDHNDKTWFDAAGNFHSNALRVTERYRMLDADTIEYQATIDDPQVYTRPWTISMQMQRKHGVQRLLEHHCQAVKEVANGDFERDENNWYPAPIPSANEPFDFSAGAELPALEIGADIRRLEDGVPDISGHYMADAGGANYGLEEKPRVFLMPASRGVVIDPQDGTLPYQAWARAERLNRELPHRGYDDPTAHCFAAAGVPRSFYVPAPFVIVQTPEYVVFLYERMSWRIVPLDDRDHLPDHMRFWQGDSVGRWAGDVLVVETQNMNGKAWLNELGDVVSHMQRVVETFTPVAVDEITYRATVIDPIPYTRPWTIEMPFDRMEDELLEVACLEDDKDLQHLKDVRDAYRAQQNQEN